MGIDCAEALVIYLSCLVEDIPAVMQLACYQGICFAHALEVSHECPEVDKGDGDTVEIDGWQRKAGIDQKGGHVWKSNHRGDAGRQSIAELILGKLK